MRRQADRSNSPPSKRSRERSGHVKRSRSPRRSHTERFSSNQHRPNHRSSDSRFHEEKSTRTVAKQKFRTLCVQNFSSKLSIEMLQELLLHEFNHCGDMSISVGHLDGKRAALIAFKHCEDAEEALRTKPEVNLLGRSVPVEILTENINADGERRKPSNTLTGRTRDTHLGEMQPSTSYTHRRKEAQFTQLFTNAAPMVGPCAPSNILGIPGITPSAMVAAAARALGLPEPTTSLPSAIAPILSSSTHTSRFGNFQHTHNRSEHSRIGQSPPSSESDADMKATRTLFVGSLEPDITEAEVVNAFERFGRIEQVDIKRATKSGAHSYAFVRYENVDMAYRARDNMSGMRIRTFQCKIGYGKAVLSNCLYKSCFGSGLSNNDALIQMLARFGKINLTEWSPDRRHIKVMFDTCESACNANNALKGMPVGVHHRTSGRIRVDFIDPVTMSQGQVQDIPSDGNRAHESVLTGSNIRMPGPSRDMSSFPPPYTRNGKPIVQYPPTGSTEQFTPKYTSHHHRSSHDDPTHDNSRFSSPRSHDRRHTGTQRTSGTFEAAAQNHNQLTPLGPSTKNLQTVVSLEELSNCLQSDVWRGEVCLKKHAFLFRCLHLLGDTEVSGSLSRSTTNSKPLLRVMRRGQLDPVWMAEATHRIHDVISNQHRGLSLMLVLPDPDSDSSNYQSAIDSKEPEMVDTNPFYPFAAMVAYFKLKRAVGVLSPVQRKLLPESESEPAGPKDEMTPLDTNLSVHLFAPSSFALSLLKQAAPRLSSEFATADNYMILLAIEQ